MEIFISTTSKIVTDLPDAELDKLQRKTFQRLNEPPENSSKNGKSKFPLNFITKKPKFMPQKSEIIEQSSSFF